MYKSFAIVRTYAIDCRYVCTRDTFMLAIPHFKIQ